ncbi:MAG: glycosyltransferase family 2 protein [Candidatus Sulfobium sp.]
MKTQGVNLLCYNRYTEVCLTLHEENWVSGSETESVPSSAGLSVTDNHLVSIITIVLNGADYIEGTIKSAISQDYPFIEYIVVDGGSTDGTVEIIKKYGDRISKWVSGPDKGISDAMNKGIRMASGLIIGMIHAGDYYEPGAIGAVVRAFLDCPDAGVVHGNMLLMSPGGTSAVACSPLRNPKKDAWKTMPVLHPTVFVRKSVYERYGVFDPAYSIAMDYDLVLRLLRSGILFKHVPRNIATMTTGGISMTNLSERYREVRTIAIKHGYNRLKVDAAYAWNTIFRPLETAVGKFLRRHGLSGFAQLYRKIFYSNVPKDF